MEGFRGKQRHENKTKVMISGEWQKVTQNTVRWLCVVEVLVIIQYSALVVRSGYTANVVGLRVAWTK